MHTKCFRMMKIKKGVGMIETATGEYVQSMCQETDLVQKDIKQDDDENQKKKSDYGMIYRNS